MQQAFLFVSPTGKTTGRPEQSPARSGVQFDYITKASFSPEEEGKRSAFWSFETYEITDKHRGDPVTYRLHQPPWDDEERLLERMPDMVIIVQPELLATLEAYLKNLKVEITNVVRTHKHVVSPAC